MEKNIIESNKLIAEFMGYENQCEDWCGSNILEMDDLFGEPFMRPFNPDKRWDDLMPVVDKIIEIDITPAPNWTGYRIEIVPRGYVAITGFPMPRIMKNVSIEGSLIMAVYEAVIEFIKSYSPTPEV